MKTVKVNEKLTLCQGIMQVNLTHHRNVYEPFDLPWRCQTYFSWDWHFCIKITFCWYNYAKFFKNLFEIWMNNRRWRHFQRHIPFPSMDLFASYKFDFLSQNSLHFLLLLFLLRCSFLLQVCFSFMFSIKINCIFSGCKNISAMDLYQHVTVLCFFLPFQISGMMLEKLIVLGEVVLVLLIVF